MRSYSDACGLARGLDVVGERWALLVVRELLLGPKRYTDLAAALPGISTNILGARLAGLEETGVLTKRRLSPPIAVTVYELTPWGRELEPAILLLGRWGARTSLDLTGSSLSATSFILSLRTNFAPARAEGVELRFGVGIGEERFVGTIHEGAFTISRSDETDVALELCGAAGALASVVYADPSTDLQSGLTSDLLISGDASGFATMIDCFALPAPVGSEHGASEHRAK